MRGRGGFIGANATPAASAVNSSASGVWTVRESESLKRAGTWPRVGSVVEAIAGLQLWLAADDASTLFDATTGGSLVAADGGVARWEDKSGNGRHLIQATSGSRPTRKTATQGSKDVLRFDGRDDGMSVANSTATFKFLHSAANTLFFVVRVRALNTRETLFDTGTLGSSSGDGGSSGALLMLFTNGAALHRLQSGANAEVSNTLATSSFVAGSSYLVSVIADPTAGTASNRSELRINGGVAIKNNTLTDSVGTGNSRQNFTIGQVIGFAGDGYVEYTEYADLDFCEIVIYNSALSSTDRAAVESYLMTKWGIA